MENNFKPLLDNVRKQAPLIHCITNYVTVNDVANVLLACGASPIMADDEGEAEEITALCAGLCVNIGTLNRRTIPAMFLSGKKAAALGRPAVLDPVGAGASRLRTETARRLLREIRPAAVRGNMSEIRALFTGSAGTRGVDAAPVDAVTDAGLGAAVRFVKETAARAGCIVAVTGAVDLISDGKKCYAVRNGRAEMSRVTGTGCQLSALTAAFLAANPDRQTDAAAAAVCAMGLAGEIAWSRMLPGDGNSAYRGRILDAVFNMTGGELDAGAKYTVL